MWYFLQTCRLKLRNASVVSDSFHYLLLFCPLPFELPLPLVLKWPNFLCCDFCLPFPRPRVPFQFSLSLFSSHWSCLSLTPPLMTSNCPPRDASEFSSRWANCESQKYSLQFKKQEKSRPAVHKSVRGFQEKQGDKRIWKPNRGNVLSSRGRQQTPCKKKKKKKKTH